MLIPIKKHETLQKIMSCENYEDLNNLLDKDPGLSMDFIKNYTPNIIKNAMRTFATDTEQTVFLYSAIVALGAIMIKISGKYSDKDVFPMLFLAVIGPPASNKSIINLASAMLEKLHKRFLAESEYLMKIYKAAHSKWRREVKTNPDLLEPIKPPYCSLLISSDITKAKFIEQLFDNKNIPSLIVGDEIDLLVNTVKSELGIGILALLRAIFHADKISQQLKGNNQHFELDSPKLSLILAGTVDQMIHLIGSIVNGLFSRFMILSLEGNVKWADVSPSQGGNERNIIIENISDSALDIFEYLATNGFEMLLTKKQWEILNSFGNHNLGILSNLHNEYTSSVVKRHGIMCFKIALTLTGLRYWKEKLTDEKVYCTDEDFTIAVILMRKSFTNAINFFGKLKNGKKSSLATKNEAFLNDLGETFTRAEALLIGKKMKLPIRSIDRIIKNLTDGKQLDKISFGNYKKTNLAKLGKLEDAIYD